MLPGLSWMHEVLQQVNVSHKKYKGEHNNILCNTDSRMFLLDDHELNHPSHLNLLSVAVADDKILKIAQLKVFLSP